MSNDENDFETIAVFNNSFEPQLAIAKSMLEEAEINYYLTNENFLSLDPVSVPPTPISIELRVEQKRKNEALEIIQSISNNNG